MAGLQEQHINEKYRFFTLMLLIIAGESIFFLPFVLARVFRPTFLTVFNLSNLELGLIFSVYGLVAMFSYFLGGPLADRFSARKLMSVALSVTAVGGLILATIPTFVNLKLLYAFWGVSTILLFWAALIRATRQWGKHSQQGRAFGFLDGGRGFMAALISSASVSIFAYFMPDDVASASVIEQKIAFQRVILFVTAIIFIISILVWFTLDTGQRAETDKVSTITLAGVKKVMSMPVAWLQAVIIICAYAGYKVTDDYSLYASDVMEFDSVRSARVGTLALWIRPFVAVIAGLIADKKSTSGMTITCFALMLLGSLVFSSSLINAGQTALFFITIITTASGVFALRGLYFAIMEEGKIPLIYTGSAVGLVSIIGYTPDVFMGPLMGILLDRSPGVAGHQHVFMVLAAFSTAGIIASILFRKYK